MTVPLGTEENYKISVMIARLEVLTAVTVKNIMGCHIVQSVQNMSMFRKNLLYPSPGYNKWKKMLALTHGKFYTILYWCHIEKFILHYMALHPRRQALFSKDWEFSGHVLIWSTPKYKSEALLLE
jgi:hypothetical protein